MNRLYFALALGSIVSSPSIIAQTSTAADPTYTSVAKHPVKYTGQVYNIKPKLDIPLTALETAWTLYGFSVVYNRDTVPYSELASLNRNNINSFDRGTSNNYSEKARAASDIFFGGSMAAPFFLLFDKRIRKDASKIGLLYLETLATTGTIYTICAMSANRFRPYSYNPDVPLAKRTRGGARNSFFAGHVAIVGTTSFFFAGIYTSYHPEMKNKWWLYAVASAATLTTGYLRIHAGQHFPTDVIVGTIVGPAVGILVPHFHKNKPMNSRLSFLPRFSQEQTGVTALYRL